MSVDVLLVCCKVFQIVVAFLGMALNCYILVLIPFSRLTIYNCMLMCLAICHCLFSILVIALELCAVIFWFHLCSAPTDQQWFYMFDNLQTTVWVIIPGCNMWIICALVIDRYLIIVIPFRYESKVNKRKSLMVILFIGILLLVISSQFWATPLIKRTEPNCSFELILSDKCEGEDITSSLIRTILVIGAFLLPCLIMVLCNIHLLIIILDHRNRIVNTIYVVQLNSGPFKHKHGPAKQRDSFVTTLNLFCTLILLLPYIVNLIGQLAFHYFEQHLSTISLLMVTLTPLVNGYIYGLRSQPIKKAFKRVLQRYLYKIQITNEIDQRGIVRANSNSKAQSLSSIFHLNIS